jgi:hypothetical protein
VALQVLCRHSPRLGKYLTMLFHLWRLYSVESLVKMVMNDEWVNIWNEFNLYAPGVLGRTM